MNTLVFEQYRRGVYCSTYADIKKFQNGTAMSVELLFLNYVIDTVQEDFLLLVKAHPTQHQWCSDRFICVCLVTFSQPQKITELVLWKHDSCITSVLMEGKIFGIL